MRIEDLRRVGRVRPPTWLLGAGVALLGWNVGVGPPGFGLDSSWNAGLAMAIEDGLAFGTEVVFAYGPLGFLRGQGVWFTDLAAIALLYSAALYACFCVALVWALRRTLPPLGAALVALLVVGALPLLELPLLLAALVCLGALARQPSQRTVWLLVAGGASFAAVEALIKLSTGPQIVLLFPLALVGLRARWWQLLAYFGLLAAELLGLWLLSGQSLAAIPDFLANTWQVVSGYSAAMLREVDVAAWKVTGATLGAALVSIALVGAAARGSLFAHRPHEEPRAVDARASWAAIALVALCAFAIFKQGVVRTDAAHLSLFFSAACVLWLALPWAKANWRWMLAGAGAIALLGIPVRPPGLPTNLDLAANLRDAGQAARALASGSRRGQLMEDGRASMKGVYRLDRPTLAALRGHTVTIEPWEIGVAWAYRLDWRPLPVLQNYLAYTAALDDINAAAVADRDGPERILREDPALVFPEFPTRGIDGRYPGWDPPAQARQTICHFAPLRTTARWQVLGRAADRCGPERPAGAVEADSGEAVAVPAAGRGEVVFARVEGVEVSGLERLAALLVRARLRTAIVNGERRYRLVPETAADGLLLRGDGRIGGRGAFAQVPGARTIAIDGAGDDLRYEFFRMRVRSP